MRWIKLYEEFVHDEIHDVMMSICDTVSFKESEKYPSTETIRVYETSEPVEFDARQYEEYLDGWNFNKVDRLDGCTIVFVKGDRREAALSWLGSAFGNLESSGDSPSFYTDRDGEVVFQFAKDVLGDEICYVSGHLWDFFSGYLRYPISFTKQKAIVGGIFSEWINDCYNLRMKVSTYYACVGSSLKAL